MAASTENTLFQTAVKRVLDSWTVLQLAVAHGFGGADSQEKSQWMVYAIDQWFKENRDIEPYELDIFLEDVMNNEFDTIIEDGSLPRISGLVCALYRLSCEGREADVHQRLETLPRPQLQQCARGPSDEEEEDEEESMETGGASAAVPPHQPPSKPTPQEEGAGPPPDAMDEEDEEDGWQVVRKGKRR